MSALSVIKEYEIHYYQVGFNKKAHITTIINLFQDIFVYQSEVIGTGFDYLADKSLTWVVSKWDIHVFKYPTYGEKVKVKMYPVLLKKFYMYVKYQVLNKDNEILSDAISLWILINTKNGKPYKIFDELYTRYALNSQDNIPISIDTINMVRKIELKKIFNVGYSDIDTNGHVNNVKYISWALDAIPEGIMKAYKLTRIKINYKKETVYNKVVFSGVEIISDRNDGVISCLHKIYTEDNTILTILESSWQKNSI